MGTLESPGGSYHFSLEGLKLLSKCPLCQDTFQPFQASIIEEKEEAQLVHIQCRKCSSSLLALIMNNPVGMTSIGLITDLSADDVDRFRQLTAISEEDVLSAFTQFSKQKKQFHNIIRNK